LKTQKNCPDLFDFHKFCSAWGWRLPSGLLFRTPMFVAEWNAILAWKPLAFRTCIKL